MKQIQLLLLIVFAVLVVTPASNAAVLHPAPSKEASHLEEGLSKKEQRQLRKEQRRNFRKALREQLRELRKNGKASDEALILYVILGLLLPPLAMFLYDGGASSRFWISLILLLLAIPLWGALGALAITASVIYTLYIILSESL